jgi:hypothetical protein
MGPYMLAPHSEQYFCKIVKLPNERSMPIRAFEHLGSPTLHHFNVWMLALTMDDEPEGDCDVLWEEANMALAAPIYASQEPTFSGEFPEGVAGQLPGNTWVLMELHAVNPSNTAVTTEAWLNAYAASPDDIEYYANGIWGSNGAIEVQPGATETIAKRCYVQEDMDVVVIGSHFHRHGVRFEVYTLNEEDEPDERVYLSEDWEAPLLEFYTDQPIKIRGGSGFEYRCTYTNEDNGVVTYGDTSDDEMCIFAAVYYPDRGFLTCKGSPF